MIVSSLTRSTFALELSVTRSKISFMDMVTADFEGAEEKFIKEFDGWLDTQSLVDAVNCISSNISRLKFRSMRYDDLVGFLMIYLEIDDVKTDSFLF